MNLRATLPKPTSNPPNLSGVYLPRAEHTHGNDRHNEKQDSADDKQRAGVGQVERRADPEPFLNKQSRVTVESRSPGLKAP